MHKGLIALCLLASAQVGAEPLVRHGTSYYYIDGPSATVLAGQLDQSGPVAADGRRYAGRTKWQAQWQFNREQKGVTCTLTQVRVVVGISQTLPKWRGEDKGAEALKSAWNRFMQALERHEDEHKQIALKAAREIEAALAATKPASNCEALTDAANAAAQAIIEKYRKADEDLDSRTDHGRSEGATLL